MAQFTTTATLGGPLSREQLWVTKTHQTERIHAMAKPRRSIRGYVGQKMLDLPTYPVFKPISLPTSWAYSMESKQPCQQPASPKPYSVIEGSSEALRKLLEACGDVLPGEVTRHRASVAFNSASSTQGGVFFPSPLKEQDAIAAIKALEACAAAAIADLRRDKDGHVNRQIVVDLDKAACFLMSAYLTTIDGKDKANPESKKKIKDTDLNQAQSIQYRRLSANLYATAEHGRFYHIHGSLDASEVLKSLGLPPFRPDLTDYDQCKASIGNRVKTFTVDQLEQLNEKAKGAGIEALTWDTFRKTAHGKSVCSLSPFTVCPLGSGTLHPSKSDPLLRPLGSSKGSDRRVLSGIKVLELCRVIAGPTVGRSLAAHGASVLKVTSPNLPDVPFFQVDVNTGKHTTDLDLKNPAHREVFDALLAEADVVIDGYRPGALDNLGYGTKRLAEIAKTRGYGFVYVAEDCFGGVEKNAEWSTRRGWQQIADCVTGVAWAQGKFMGRNEPVVPPFPMSDYGTGALGCIAAMVGLYRRATQGGSWVCRTSLVQYDVFLMGLGQLPAAEQGRLRQEHDREFFGLRYDDSVDEVGKRAMKSMKRVTPHLFDERLIQSAGSGGFVRGEVFRVRWPREAIRVEGIQVGHVRPSRNNGCDGAGWGEWEVDGGMVGELEG